MKKLLLLLSVLFCLKAYPQQQVYNFNSGNNLSDFTFTTCAGFCTDSYSPRKVTFQDGFSITCGRFYKQYFNNSLISVAPYWDSIIVKVKWKTSPGYSRNVRVQAEVLTTLMYDDERLMVTDVDSGFIYFNAGSFPTNLPFDVKFIAGKTDTSLNNFYVFFYECSIKGYLTPPVGIETLTGQPTNWWYYGHKLIAAATRTNAPFRVYDMSGRKVYEGSFSTEGAELPLEPGLYLVTAGREHLKILVDSH